MSKMYTHEESKERMAMLMASSSDVIEAYRDAKLDELRDALERAVDFATIRFIQGQIAGIRDFCSTEQE